MQVAFQNLFGGTYEGGARWLESTLVALGMVQDRPQCFVLGASKDTLPASLQNEKHVEAIPLERSSHSRLKNIKDAAFRRVLRTGWEDEALTAVAARNLIDVWVGFAGFEGLGPDRTLLVWQPDFQFRHFPEFFGSEMVQTYERIWDRAARRANGVLVISETVRQDALKSHPEIGDKVFVAGFTPTFSEGELSLKPYEVCRRYNLPNRYFIVCNQFFQHKNHLLVLEAMKRIRNSGTSPASVVFTGRTEDFRRPNFFSELLQFVEQNGLHEAVYFLGVVPRNEQIALIRSADAVIQPSRFEGRGAIGEEAAVLGTQLLCSDLPVHRELDIPGAIFFDADNIEGLQSLMRRDYPKQQKCNSEIISDSQKRTRKYGERLMEILARVAANGVNPIHRSFAIPLRAKTFGS
jgi:glycosyltransferase involved in cell wall biosynthesis